MFCSLILTDARNTYIAYALTEAYLPNFSLPIAFTYMIRQSFLPQNISHVQYPAILYR